MSKNCISNVLFWKVALVILVQAVPRIVDLSHRLNNAPLTWPGSPPPPVSIHSDSPRILWEFMVCINVLSISNMYVWVVALTMYQIQCENNDTQEKCFYLLLIASTTNFTQNYKYILVYVFAHEWKWRILIKNISNVSLTF